MPKQRMTRGLADRDRNRNGTADSFRCVNTVVYSWHPNGLCVSSSLMTPWPSSLDMQHLLGFFPSPQDQDSSSSPTPNPVCTLKYTLYTLGKQSKWHQMNGPLCHDDRAHSVFPLNLNDPSLYEAGLIDWRPLSWWDEWEEVVTYALSSFRVYSYPEVNINI